MSLIKREAWCIPCILNRTPNRAHTEVHHTLSGGKRTGDSYGNCLWHHRGLPDRDDLTRHDMMVLLGPPLAFGSKAYVLAWAREPHLVKLQDYLIELYLESGGWEQYNLPVHIGRAVRVRCQELRGQR